MATKLLLVFGACIPQDPRIGKIVVPVLIYAMKTSEEWMYVFTFC
jgi:hypothetical protein